MFDPNVKIKSTGHFKTKSSILTFYFDLFYLLKKGRPSWTKHVLGRLIALKWRRQIVWLTDLRRWTKLTFRMIIRIPCRSRRTITEKRNAIGIVTNNAERGQTLQTGEGWTLQWVKKKKNSLTYRGETQVNNSQIKAWFTVCVTHVLIEEDLGKMKLNNRE